MQKKMALAVGMALSLSAGSAMAQMQTNFLSHFLMVSQLMPHMAGSSGATLPDLNLSFRTAGRTLGVCNVRLVLRGHQ